MRLAMPIAASLLTWKLVQAQVCDLGEILGFTGDETSPPPTDVPNAIASVISDVGNIINNDSNLGPKFVRLAFHDCVGDAGCDGCVDLNNADNDGLRRPMDSLRPVCDNVADFLTRADCWAIAGLAAAENMQNNNNAVDFSYLYYGRPTCSGADAIGDAPSNNALPSAHVTTAGLLEFFENEFGFDSQQTVAIMGAHSLGRVSNQNSGFDGAWVPNRDALANDFHEHLIEQDYVQTNQGNDNNEFLWLRLNNNRRLQRDGRRIMLNADMALVLDFEGDITLDPGTANHGRVGCTFSGASQCPFASTRAQVQAYEASEATFLQDFRDAFTIMTIKGPSTAHCTAGQLCNVATSP